MSGEEIEMSQSTSDGTRSQPPESAGLIGKDGKSPAKSKWVGATKKVTNVKSFLSDEKMSERKKAVTVDRRRAHLQKFGGRVKGDVAAPAPPAQRVRRAAAPVVLYKAGVEKLSAKPQVKSTWQTFGGRSFLSSDWKDADEADGEDEAMPLDFFDFTDAPVLKERIGGETIEIEEDIAVGGVFDFVKDESNIDKLVAFGKKALPVRPKKKKKKAWMLFGKLLQRRMKSSMKDYSSFEDRREFFTFWLSFVQTIIMIVVLATYPFAPIGIDTEEVRREVLLNREGVVYQENLGIKVVETFWIGPTLESLILLGAKYAPCMRRDEKVFKEIIKDRAAENATGCCMALQNTGCVQRFESECMTPSVEFGAGKVCGQDPKFCASATIPPDKWNPTVITKWPKCDKPIKAPDVEENRHVTCEVAGRPCCVKTQGQCVITTRDNCEFRGGMYHPEYTLCSQVDCLSATCGNSFYNNDQPDQIYRLFISLFLSAGILHLVIQLIFNFTILMDIEGYAGWFRTGLIFILTGAGGNLWSSVFLPYQAEVGESGAMFGVFACLFVEGVQNWSNIDRPWRYFLKLVIIFAVALLFGLLPMVDNFSHIFGFIYGLLIGFVALPTIPMKDPEGDPEGHKKEVRLNLLISGICLVLAVLLTLLGLFLFYTKQDTQSAFIAAFNCPFGEKFCLNFHQGGKIEPRKIIY